MNKNQRTSSNNQQGTSKRKGQPSTMRLYRNIREPLVTDATLTTLSTWDLTTDGGGNVGNFIPVSPLGFYVPLFTSPSGGGTVTISGQKYGNAVLPWLFNQCKGFERYRVLRAKLIFVGSVGSTATGRLTLSSSTDLADASTLGANLTPARSTGGKVFDLALASSKELSLNMDVDSSWKKVTATTYGTNGGALLMNSSANDILFTNVLFNVVGGPASTTVGTLFLDYDVEFKDPVNVALNF